MSGSPREKEIKSILENVQFIYKELSTRPVNRNCLQRTECCQFKVSGKTPFLTRGEAMLAFKAFRATGRKVSPKKSDGSCPLLDANNRCLIYEQRPFACRTHFCKLAGGPYSRSEVVDLIHRLDAIDVALGGSGPESIQVALEKCQKSVPQK